MISSFDEITYEYFGEDYCFYCGTSKELNGLQEHHIFPGSFRKKSPTVWLCYKCHKRVHKSSKFLKLIQQLYERRSQERSSSNSK